MNAPLTYTDLLGVEVRDCGEPFVHVGEELPQVVLSPINDDMRLYPCQGMTLRRGTVAALEEAATALSQRLPRAQLKLVYCYRHPEVQRRYFEDVSMKIQGEHPNLTPLELRSRTHQLIASPDVAGHPTGGAIDVTVTQDGRELDMGTRIWDLSLSELIPTFSTKIAPTAMENRLLLRTVLMDAGFAPFDGEWWHFSFGDREWAAYYSRRFAIYDQIDLPKGG